VVYEAPHRIAETMKDIVALLGVERPIVLARELTKVHEEFIRGRAAEVLQHVQKQELKGEMTLLIGKAEGRAETSKKRDVAARLQEIMHEQRIDENAALKMVAKEQGISKSEAYRELQRVKRKK
jgi:16S rRNA (cytidine1402-2'-O)-methyltransferase